MRRFGSVTEIRVIEGATVKDLVAFLVLLGSGMRGRSVVFGSKGRGLCRILT